MRIHLLCVHFRTNKNEMDGAGKAGTRELHHVILCGLPSSQVYTVWSIHHEVHLSHTSRFRHITSLSSLLHLEHYLTFLNALFSIGSQQAFDF